jgi:glycosyltransferase involved in cell wall biosynthesis
MRHPLVSIVLPTYNGEKYLREAIDSCINQSYQNIELIIVDDASTDNTPIIIEQSCKIDSRIISISHLTNKKLPASLNTGFNSANGDYLTWTSDDNIYNVEAIERMVVHLNDNCEHDGVYCDYTTINYYQNNTQYVRVSKINDLLTLHNCIGPCFLYRRSVHDIVGPYAEDLFLAEDYDFWVRVTANFRIEPLHEDLYIYRLHPKSLTWQYRNEARWKAEVALASHLKNLSWLRTDDLAIAHRSLLDSAIARKDLKSALRYFKCGCVKAPLRFLTLCMESAVQKYAQALSLKPRKVDLRDEPAFG